MSATRRDTHCPECASTDIAELARMEGDVELGPSEDITIYHCQECDAEWDTEPASPEPMTKR